MKRSLQATLALIKADIASQARSWVLRGWVAALVLVQFFAIATSIVGARAVRIPASTIIATNLSGFIVVWSIVIIVLAAGSVSLEAEIISDGILSRACTRTQFIVAKLIARAAVILAIYAVAVGAVAYAAYRYAPADVLLSSVLISIGIVGLAILLLVSIGVLFSVAFQNMVLSVVALLLLWYVASPVFTFLGAEYLSPASLTRTLPVMLKDPNAPQVLHCTATEKTVTVVFSEPLDRDTAENVLNYEIDNGDGGTLAAATATYDRQKTSVLLGGVELAPGTALKVRVQGVTDTGGTPVSPSANSCECTVSSANKADTSPAERPARRDREPPRLTRITATQSSIRAVFSEPLGSDTAEDPANYRVENPPGTEHTPRAITWEPSTRSVLLSGLSLDLNVPVKLTVQGVKDRAGNPISPRANSLLYTELAPWRYLLGFGIPTLAAILLAIVLFNRKDL